jgi:hypothetical protein
MKIGRLFLSALLLASALLRAEEGAAALGAPPPDPFAGVPAPLAEAVRKFGHDIERWACLQREVQYDKDGKVSEERLVRYDPSLPYDEQWTLVQKNGKDATERQAKAYREEKEKHRKDRKTLGELLELPKAAVVAETPDSLTYEVPLRAEGNRRLPPDRFQVLFRVDRARQEFLSIEVKLRKPLRVALVGKIKQAGAKFDFMPVDARFAAPLSAIKAAGSGSVLFIPVSASYELTRTEFKRVRPYSDRFNVKLGPLKWLDF